MTKVFVHWYGKDDDSKWYEFRIENKLTTNEYFRLYENIVKWLEASIDAPTRHARWNITTDCIKVKFRYERDYMMCVLRWS